jgi:hypothetical protein
MISMASLMEVFSVIEIGFGIISALIFMASSPHRHPSSCLSPSLLHG